jgi:hypothetical protein
MSTLLSDLDSSPAGPAKDGDLVDQILKEMNGPPLPPTPAMIPAQMSNTAVNAYNMATNPSTAHVIGGAHPTPADFAAAMHSSPQFASGNPYQEAQAPAQQVAYRPPKKSYTQRFGEEFKVPILVSIIVFLFSLPVINMLFAHYLPSTVLSTGQLSTIGLLIKSLGGGLVFWILQRVVVPLLSL